MDLSDYTDEQLREELKRRKILKRQARGDFKDYTPKYLYASAIVTYANIHPGNKGYWKFKVEFTDEAIAEYGDALESGRSYGITQSVFNKGNAPRVGDLVKLKKRITNQSQTWSRSWASPTPVICEVLKRKEDEQ